MPKYYFNSLNKFCFWDSSMLLCNYSLFISITIQDPIVQIYLNTFIHYAVDRNLVLFPVMHWFIVPLWKLLCMFLGAQMYVSHGYIPKSRTTRFLDTNTLMFNLSKYCQKSSKIYSYTNSFSYKHYMRFPVNQRLWQLLVLSVFKFIH